MGRMRLGRVFRQWSFEPVTVTRIESLAIKTHRTPGQVIDWLVDLHVKELAKQEPCAEAVAGNGHNPGDE